MHEPRILNEEEKQHELIYDLEFLPLGTTLDSKVRCKKCGKEFIYKESTVLELFDVVGYYEMVKCKHYPECDGLRQDYEVIK